MGKKVKKDEKPPPDDVFDPLLVESRQAQTVVLMLSSVEEDVLSKACEAIYKFVEKCDENKKLLFDLGALDPLLRLIQHEERLVRRNACMAFGVMACHPDVRRALKKKEETVPAIVSLLNPEEDAVVHEFAALCLSSLSHDFSSKTVIVEQNGVEPLIRCLSSSDPDVQKNSIETLALMLQDYQARTAIRELNGIQPMMDLLKSEFAIIQELALLSLDRTMQDPENRAAFRELEGLKEIINFIGNPEYNDLHTMAVSVLSTCLEDVETMQQIKESGGLQKLVALITDVPPPEEEEKGKKGKDKKSGKEDKKGKKGKADEEDDKQKKEGDSIIPTLPDVKMFAAKAIARAAKNGENRKILHEIECEKMLILLLGHEDPNVQIAAAQAMAVMSENLTCKQSIGDWEGIEPLVKLLKKERDENQDVKEAVCLALANLTTGNQSNCQEVCNFGGIEPLINILADGKDMAIANACVILTNMSTEENLRSAIQAQSVVTALIDPLKSPNPVVQSKAALAVAAFVLDSEARTEFRLSGGLEPLVQLLKANDKDVSRSASWAITVIADDASAGEICKFGGLELLQDIQMSSTRANRFGDAAMDKLLDSNLSAKYALTGYLGPHNIIRDGFFDAGAVKPGHRFQPLEVFGKQEVDQRRPVILINSCVKEPDASDQASELAKEESKVTAKVSKTGGKDSKSLVNDNIRQSSMVSERKLSQRRRSSQISTEAATTIDKITPRQSVGGSVSTPVKSRAAKEKEERLKEEELAAQLAQERDEPVDKPYVPPTDPVLEKYVREVIETIQPLPTTREQCIALAQYVGDKMGGPIDRGQVANFSYELPISEIKFNLKSNVVPIGMIKTGIHYHRALLFKALADYIAIGCSLQRGEYNRAWNEVMLTDDSDAPGAPKFPPKKFIVDLIHQPGRLMRSDSADAVNYQKL